MKESKYPYASGKDRKKLFPGPRQDFYLNIFTGVQVEIDCCIDGHDKHFIDATDVNRTDLMYLGWAINRGKAKYIPEKKAWSVSYYVDQEYNRLLYIPEDRYEEFIAYQTLQKLAGHESSTY